MKRASMNWFATDWLGEPLLRMCSLAARGLWIDMVCLMQQSEEFGVLLVKGQAPTLDDIAAMISSTPDAVSQAFAELERRGVFSRRDGVIICRRMLRDAAKYERDVINGKRGGNPALLENRADNPPDKALDKPPHKARAGARGQGMARNGSGGSSSPAPDVFPGVHLSATADAARENGADGGARHRAPTRLEAYWCSKFLLSRGVAWTWTIRKTAKGPRCSQAQALNECLGYAGGDHAEVERRIDRLLASQDAFTAKKASPRYLATNWMEFAVEIRPSSGAQRYFETLDNLPPRNVA